MTPDLAQVPDWSVLVAQLGPHLSHIAGGQGRAGVVACTDSPAIPGVILTPHERGLELELVPDPSVQLTASDPVTKGFPLRHINVVVPWCAIEAALAARPR